MKKISVIGLTIGLLLIANTTFAQVRMGVKGGLSLSKVDFSGVAENFDKKNHGGYFIGPTLEFVVPGVGLGVDGALLFSQRTFEANEREVKQTGIEIPLNLKYIIGFGKQASVFVSAGPDLFFDFEKNRAVWEPNYSMKQDRTRAEIALNFGVGARLLKHFQLGLTYNIPLNYSSKLMNINIEEGTYKVKTLQVSASYFF